MSLRSRKHNRSYLRKLWFLRNFLYLLRSYRIFLRWKRSKRKRLKRLVWITREAILWKTFQFSFCRIFEGHKIYTVVLYRYFNFQVTATCLISFKPFKLITILDAVSIDNVYSISLGKSAILRKRALMALTKSNFGIFN